MAPDDGTVLRVRLTAKSIAAIELSVGLAPRDSKTDTINRALQFYALMQQAARGEPGSYKVVSDLGPQDLLIMSMRRITRFGGIEPL